MSRGLTKEALFVPSFQSDIGDYPELTEHLQKAGVNVRAINPDWDKHTTIVTMYEEVAEQIDQLDPDPDTILLGHSIGARIAGAEATRRNYGRLVLCSFSADYSDIVATTEGRQVLEKISPHGQKLARSLALGGLLRAVRVPKGERRILVGSEEPGFRAMIAVARRASLQLETDVQVVPSARHTIDSAAYVNAAARAVVGVD